MAPAASRRDAPTLRLDGHWVVHFVVDGPGRWVMDLRTAGTTHDFAAANRRVDRLDVDELRQLANKNVKSLTQHDTGGERNIRSGSFDWSPKSRREAVARSSDGRQSKGCVGDPADMTRRGGLLGFGNECVGHPRQMTD